MNTTHRSRIARPRSIFNEACAFAAQAGYIDPYVARIEAGEDEAKVTDEWFAEVAARCGTGIDTIEV